MLELKHISFHVNGEQDQQKEILRDINLVVEDKSFVIITGPNGGGKSTLAKIIMEMCIRDRVCAYRPQLFL